MVLYCVYGKEPMCKWGPEVRRPVVQGPTVEGVGYFFFHGVAMRQTDKVSCKENKE